MTPAARTSPYTAHNTELDPAGAQQLGSSLLDWYRRERRNLPWRRTRDPYCIWVSEIMLQQTRVQSVVSYYERWMRRFPTVRALAEADGEDVLRAWEGLGYYSRARNLQKAARLVVESHAGQLPTSIHQLRGLPGIGPYSAGAIASIAFDADEPVVDGNVMRVLARVFALSGDPRREPLAGRLWGLARALLPRGRAGEFNQALMELGATICTPRNARCSECPIAMHCRALAQGRVLELPERTPRPAPTEERRALAVVWRRGRVLVLRAAADAPRWAGMWQFPNVKLEAGEDARALLHASIGESTGICASVGDSWGNLQHQVTRFRIRIELYAARAESARVRAPTGNGVRWCTPSMLSDLAMPVAHRKVARALLEGSPEAAGSRTRPAARRSRAT